MAAKKKAAKFAGKSAKRPARKPTKKAAKKAARKAAAKRVAASKAPARKKIAKRAAPAVKAAPKAEPRVSEQERIKKDWRANVAKATQPQQGLNSNDQSGIGFAIESNAIKHHNQVLFMDLLICSDFQLAFVLRVVCGATVGPYSRLVKGWSLH